MDDKNIESDVNSYSTFSINFAAYLRMKGFELIGTERSEKYKRTKYIFKDQADNPISEHKLDFANDIFLGRYLSSLQALRNLN